MTEKKPTMLKSVLKLVLSFFGMVITGLFKMVYGARGEKMPPIKNLLLLESATSLAHKIRSKKITSVEVVNAFIERIEEVNPLLNCVVANRFEDARKEAREVDKLIDSGTIPEEDLKRTKPFLGVPFTTKDCIAIKDMVHTAGLYARKDCIATDDADSIRNLRQAGAIPIALTNISELCMWWESYNPIYGRTRNPYDTNRIVGGSSGGEGCIQAAAGSAFGVGADIGGSIRIPSFCNGIFGHKSTRYAVSNTGQHPEPVNKEQDGYSVIGPMCRRAEDLLPLLKVLVKKQNLSELNLDEPVDIKKLRYFYQENDTDGFLISKVSADIRECFKKFVVYMKKAHNIAPERVQIKRLAKSRPIWLTAMKYEGPQFDEHLTDMKYKLFLPWELFKWCIRCSQHTLIALLTAVLEKFSPKIGSAKYEHCMEEGNRLRMELSDMLGDDGVLLYPTQPTPPLYHSEPLFKPFNFFYTGVVNIMGFPSTHVPFGLNKDGLPIGIQVISNLRNDRICIAVARELEKAFGGWVPIQAEE